MHVYKYALRNPVKARITYWVGDYAFSSYAGEVGSVRLPLMIHPPTAEIGKFVPADYEDRDHWLNQPHSTELNQAIRTGLRSKDFKIHPDPRTRRKFDLSF